jgi:hypothetical protein
MVLHCAFSSLGISLGMLCRMPSRPLPAHPIAVAKLPEPTEPDALSLAAAQKRLAAGWKPAHEVGMIEPPDDTPFGLVPDAVWNAMRWVMANAGGR